MWAVYYRTMPAFNAYLTSRPTEVQYQNLGDLAASSLLTIMLPGQVSFMPPVAIVDYHLTDMSLARAVVEAVRMLGAVGLEVARLEDEDMVNLEDIAQRIGVSREAVRRWSTGQRGDGTFPPAVTPLTRDGASFWSWATVAPWLSTHGHPVKHDSTLVAANQALTMARLMADVPDGEVLLSLL